MAKYIHKFETQAQFESAYNSDAYIEPWLSYTVENTGTRYNKSTYEKMLGTPLTFKIISGGSINWLASNASNTKTIQYKKNDGDWTSITSNTGSSAPSISVNNGDTVQFRGNNNTYGNGEYDTNNTFSGTTAVFETLGNVMSLISATSFSNLTTLSYMGTFGYLFVNCTGLTSAENLLLPATRLASRCYSYMFQGCTSLITAPSILPASSLTNYCYNYMFSGCTSLTATPELPATTLASECYAYMFSKCSSLTTAPELPATRAAESCYEYMFAGCTGLTAAPELPATTLATNCYRGMFSGCINLNTAPSELPATTLTKYCYCQMFYSCTTLTTAPALPATTLAESCYYQMFSDCTNLTTAPELPAATVLRDSYRYMFSYCRSLNYIKCLATNISATNCTGFWVNNVARTGTFVKAASMNDWTRSENGIPSNWTVQDAS